MIGLKIHDIIQYEEFIRGRNSEPFIKFALYGGADRYCHIFLSTGESFDETTDLNRSIAICDAYYGDDSSVIQLFQGVNKPVMVEDVEIIN